MIAKPSTHSLPSRLRAASAGLLLAVFTLLFGQGMGIVFGLNEDLIKSQLKADATAVQTTIYKDDQNVSKAVLDKSWNYMQRAHLHAGGLGTAAIALIIVLCLIGAPRLATLLISIALGAGGLGYSIFWMWAGFRARPALGARVQRRSPSNGSQCPPPAALSLRRSPSLFCFSSGCSQVAGSHRPETDLFPSNWFSAN
ncbi:MAG: hypothetical protein KBF76_17555 [Verrucomicrobiales bacterium]|nr:hypothetical protein [Verrucomicrobiales bacterium]